MAVNASYVLLGHEVDRATQKKYADKKYSFMGRLIGLDGIHLWATDEDIARQFPERAAEAKAIIAEIEAEITGASKGNGQKKSFHSFVEELQAIYRDEMANCERVQNAFDIAEKDYNATMEDRAAPDPIKLIARGDYERAKMDLVRDKRKVQDSYNTRVHDLRQRMADYAENIYRVTPDRIDQGAMQLLEIGVMSASEMDHLASQYRDNVAMMRVIGQFAQRKAKSFSDSRSDEARKYSALGLKLSNIGDIGNALSGFDQLSDFGKLALSSEARLSKARNSHWDHMYSLVCSAYDDFIVQPDGGAAATARKDAAKRQYNNALDAALNQASSERTPGNVVYRQE